MSLANKLHDAILGTRITMISHASSVCVKSKQHKAQSSVHTSIDPWSTTTTWAHIAKQYWFTKVEPLNSFTFESVCHVKAAIHNFLHVANYKEEKVSSVAFVMLFHCLGMQLAIIVIINSSQDYFILKMSMKCQKREMLTKTTQNFTQHI